MSWLGHFIVAGRCPDGQKYRCPKVGPMVRSPKARSPRLRSSDGQNSEGQESGWSEVQMNRSPDSQ